MTEQDDSIFGGLFSEPAENIQPEKVGALDYLTDIPVGAIKGVSQAVQGVLQLGAMPFDYLADTNLITAIDNIFEKITPETDTAVGDITSILGQFALPAGAAVKIANGVLKLSKAAKDYIAEKGFDKQYGARPLKRAIQKYIEDALAEEIITSHIQSGDKIIMDLDKKNQELTIKIEKAEKPAKS